MRMGTLGRTGFPVSEVGFGAWTIGGDANAVGNLGAVDDDVSVAAIHRALELGVNWIDTAPGYGCGHSERVVGRAIADLDDPPLIFTKCGFVWDDAGYVSVDITPDIIRRDVDQSLERLGVEAIDLYQIHWVEPENDPEIEDAWATLAELKAAGKVRAIGVSNFDVAQIERCEAIEPVDTLQPPYSLLERGIEEALLPYCHDRDLGVLVYSPMQSGLLTGRFSRERVEALAEADARRFDPNFAEPLLTRNLAIVDELSRHGAGLGLSPGQLAIAWAVANPAVDCAIVGFRTPEQVDGILAGADFGAGDALIAEITALAEA
jgi:aryl-alcohol dehydrogenase-like predicted oxidoreductase